MGSWPENLEERLVPLFPLPNCVLFPHVVLPLHVFEPRYRAMVRDMQAKTVGERWLSIALLRQGYDGLYHTKLAPIHPVVCVGQMIDCDPVEDGRFTILVLGRRRAVVTAENHEKEYRRIVVSEFCQAKENTESLNNVMGRIQREVRHARDKGLVEAKLFECLESLVATPLAYLDNLAFHLIPSADVTLKQRVLDEPDPVVRAEILERWFGRLIRCAEKATKDAQWPPPTPCN